MKLYGIENIHRGRKVFIPQQHTHTFISVSAISYFLSKGEELFSFSYEKAHPITEELNLFFGWWIVKHMINKRTNLEMKAIDRSWYGLNTEFLRNSQSLKITACYLLQLIFIRNIIWILFAESDFANILMFIFHLLIQMLICNVLQKCVIS